MSDVGSDQNYLEVVQSPVPGVLIFDQISRSYFPSRGDDRHEMAIGDAEGDAIVNEEEDDEDIRAMRQHMYFLFAETEP